MEDSTAKTIDFLRARLLAERSVSRAARLRANELAKKVTELEKQLKFVSLQRKKAEKATADILAILENHGRNDLSEPFDSSSDQEEMSSDFKDNKHVEKSQHVKESDMEEFSGSEVESSSVNGKSLSWKSSKNSSSRFPDKKYMDASRRRRNSFTSTGSSPRRVGKSCRQIRHKEHRSGADVAQNADATIGHRGDEEQMSSEGVQDSADVATENSLELKDPTCSCNGHAVQNYGTEREMERALEHQARFISRYKEEEKAQREWEDKFRENNGSTPDSCDPGTHSDVTEEIDETKAPSPPPPSSTDKLTPGSQEIDPGVVDANFSEIPKIDPEPLPDHKNNDMENQQSDDQNHQPDLQGTPTIFSQSQASSSQGNPYEHTPETQKNPDKLGSVLEALQQAKLSLKQNLNEFPLLENKPSIPDYRHGDEFPVPFSSAGLFRLPTDYEYGGTTPRSNSFTYDPRLSLTNNPTNHSGPQFMSIPFRESNSRSAASLDVPFHVVPTFPYHETMSEIPRLPRSALNPRLDTNPPVLDPRSDLGTGPSALNQRLGIGPSTHDPRLGVGQTPLDPRLGVQQTFLGPRLGVGSSTFDPRLETGPPFIGDRYTSLIAGLPPSSRYRTLPGGDIPLRTRSLYDDYTRPNTYK